MKRKISIVVLLVLSLVVLVVGCKYENPKNELETIKIKPDAAALLDGDIQEFTAVGENGFGEIVVVEPEWNVSGDIGAIDTTKGQTTTFAATAIGSGRITAKVGDITGSAAITVSRAESVLTSVEVAPASVTLNESDQQLFTVTGKDQYGDQMAVAPQWSVTGGIGTVSPVSGATTTFTATIEGAGTVVAAIGDVNGSAAVTVNSAGQGVVSGYVTDGRGGPAIAGAEISWNTLTTMTDVNGYFELTIPANQKADLLVQKEGRAGARVQDIQLEDGETLSLEIPNRAPFNPTASITPPVITVDITEGEILSGIVAINVEISGDNSTYLLYPYLDGEQRYPVSDELVIDEDSTTIDLDTSLYPNGASKLRFLAYDKNENAALLLIPVYIDNIANDEVLPDDLSVLEVVAFTYGENIGYYSKTAKRLEQRVQYILPSPADFDLEAAPAGAALFVNLTWGTVANADGYLVYRSFDGVDYSKVGSVTAPRYDDFSPLLKANQSTYYRVVPYNSYGEGNGLERAVTPLPALNVYLESPANMAYDISLTPTFEWRVEKSSQFPDGVEYYHEFTLFDATDYQIWFEEINNENSFLYNGTALQPGGIYSWDIAYSDAFVLYEYDGYGYSYAISIAGETGGTGSVNGEFIFTTTTVGQAN